jgi:hypothetical protein
MRDATAPTIPDAQSDEGSARCPDGRADPPGDSLRVRIISTALNLRILLS